MNAGGVEGFTIDAAQAVIKAGGRVLVASSGGAMVPLLKAIGARHVFVPFKRTWRRYFPPAILWSLYKIFSKQKIDVVYAGSRLPAWYGFLLARWFGVPFVTGFHGVYSGYHSFLKKIYNAVMTHGDIIHAVSGFVQKHIKEIYRPKNPIVVIYGGVDEKKNSPAAIAPAMLADAKQQLQNIFPHYQNPRVIFMPGRVSYLKGQWFLVKTFIELWRNKAMRAQCDNVVVLLQSVGRPWVIKKLQRLVHQHGLSTSVGFLPYQDDMLPFYELSTMVVNASRRPESFGRTTVEAMACKKIVIAPNHGAALEQIQHDTNGFLFVADSSTSLAGVIINALRLTREQKIIMGEHARQTVIEKFSLIDKQEQLAQLFALAIKNKKGKYQRAS